MDTISTPVKEKKRKLLQNNWVVAGLCVSIIAAIIFTSFYGVFERQAKENINNPIETEENLLYLYKNCYILYRDLYNRQNQSNLSYEQLYLETKESYQQIEKNGESMPEAEEVLSQDGMTALEIFYEISGGIQYLEAYLNSVENSFSELNSKYDYIIEDLTTGEIITNLTNTNVVLDEQYFYVSFVFDENGNASLDSTILGNDMTKLRKNATEAIRKGNIRYIIEESFFYDEQYLKIKMPTNCRVTFCINHFDWAETDPYESYRTADCGSAYIVFILIVFILGLSLFKFSASKPWINKRICRPYMGVLFCLYIIVMALGNPVIRLVVWVNSDAIENVMTFLPSSVGAIWVVYGINLIILTLIFFSAWYLGICTRALRELGLKGYIKKRCLIYKILLYIKKKMVAVYREVEHLDVTKDVKKIIIKIVIANGIILFIIGCFPFGGLVMAIIYSLLLYVVLKKYVSKLQKRYGILLQATNEIAEGNLNTDITEDLGVFEPFKPQIVRIQDGFKKAVEEELKSQKMKSELITNVSHDLKTPLTAIITYINLLKDENITEEQRKEYIDTLERKSLRLKVLIEDLFEVSKANSRNLTLNRMDVDIINLLKQVSFEMSDKLKEQNLEVRMDLPEEKVILSLDSQKTYRIFENLLGNVAKYAMPSTRVYITAQNTETNISITIKNITAQEIMVSAEELTERFVRGDTARNTEGSGLGLAIVKSFTEIQAGTFRIDIDGDLFKATIIFPKINQTPSIS